jgi:hypothetical protein
VGGAWRARGGGGCTHTSACGAHVATRHPHKHARARLHECVVQAVCVDGVVHVRHDLAGQAPGLEVPRDHGPVVCVCACVRVCVCACVRVCV